MEQANRVVNENTFDNTIKKEYVINAIGKTIGKEQVPLKRIGFIA